MTLRRAAMLIAIALSWAIVGTSLVTAGGGLALLIGASVQDVLFAIAFSTPLVVLSTLVLSVTGWGLSRRLDALGHRLQGLQADLESAERRAVAGAHAARIAHDCNNVASAVRLNARWLQDELRGDQAHAEAARDLNEGVEQLTALVRRLKDVAATDLPEPTDDVDLAALVRQELAVIRQHERVRDCTVALSVEAAPRGAFHIPLLRQVVDNLVINAADATGGAGLVEVRVRREHGLALVEVHDDGPGVPGPEQERVFQPRYTTKGYGSGLGLSSVRACVDAHGGGIEIGDSELGGACFRVTLPLEQAARKTG